MHQHQAECHIHSMLKVTNQGKKLYKVFACLGYRYRLLYNSLSVGIYCDVRCTPVKNIELKVWAVVAESHLQLIHHISNRLKLRCSFKEHYFSIYTLY